MSFSSRRRSDTHEWMDSIVIAPEDFARCLADLATVNRLTRAAAPTLQFVARASAVRDGFTLVDAGFGEGDMLRAIARWAATQGKRAELFGIDLNPSSARAARLKTPPDMAIDYATGDIFNWQPTSPPDLIVSSLFAHHLTDDQLVDFLRWMDATAQRGWFINDLHRHWIAYHGFRLISALARWHRFVRHDGPLSVARSFTRADWTALLERARIDPACVTIRWHMPFRLCLTRLK